MAITMNIRAWERTAAFARERRAFGRPLSGHQAIRHKLVDLATSAHACRCVTYDALRRFVAGENPLREVTMAGSPVALGVNPSPTEGLPLARRRPLADVIALSAGPKPGSSGQKTCKRWGPRSVGAPPSSA